MCPPHPCEINVYIWSASCPDAASNKARIVIHTRHINLINFLVVCLRAIIFLATYMCQLARRSAELTYEYLHAATYNSANLFSLVLLCCLLLPIAFLRNCGVRLLIGQETRPNAEPHIATQQRVIQLIFFSDTLLCYLLPHWVSRMNCDLDSSIGQATRPNATSNVATQRHVIQLFLLFGCSPLLSASPLGISDELRWCPIVCALRRGTRKDVNTQRFSFGYPDALRDYAN